LERSTWFGDNSGTGIGGWSYLDAGRRRHDYSPGQRPADDTPNIHTAFEVDNFAEALEAMTEAGYEIIKGPIERADGQRAFYVYDPEGNRLEFTTKSGLKPSNRMVDEMGYSRDTDE
jgi:catechol 2,3-dioxygenase-like lactoylglutathione lyase family enzyme